MEEKELIAIMVEAYREHLIPQWYVFRPYFEWIADKGNSHLRIFQVREMRRVALSLLKQYDEKHPDAFGKMGTTDWLDPIFPYDAYGEDKVIVSILNRIIEELTPFLILSVD